jgi:hypothetical protein
MKNIAFIVLIIALSAIGSAQAESKFFTGTTEELHKIRAVADTIRNETGSPYASPPSGPGVYCLGFWGTWWCGDMLEACYAPPYTTSCGTVPMFGGVFQVPIGHAWGPSTGAASAGLPGPLDYMEMSPGQIAAYEGQTRTVDGDEVTVPNGVTFDELPVPAQNAIISHVCTGQAAEKCQAGVIYCCE